jgi:7-cyano-7-deazaguanine synthase in queuosine biosynthesis
MDIPFDSNWKNVAISVSGGADSALLAYLVCQQAKEYDTTIHIFNQIRCWKTKPWQQDNANDVYDWLFQKFYHTKFVRHNNFIAPELEYGNSGPNLIDEYGKKVSGDNIQQRAYAEFICTKNKIDAYYNGVTRNPRLSLFNGMSERDIEPTDENKHLGYMIHMGIVVSHPFRFVDKSWIIKKYKDLGITELLDLTRSCEGTFEDITYKNYTSGQYVPLCGECFWCKEREWAIEQSK